VETNQIHKETTMKNLHFILDYIQYNPDSTHTTIRRALLENTGLAWMRSYPTSTGKKLRPNAHYTWYFSSCGGWGKKKGFDYGYYTKENGKYALTEKGIARLKRYEK
jgi:hypothetical protein